MNVNAAPAYTSVMARQSLHRPMYVEAPPPPPPLPNPQPVRVQYGMDVREYVRRAFDEENAVPGITIAELQTKLKDIIGGFGVDAGKVDWTSHPLPQELIIREREQATTQSIPAARFTNPSAYSPLSHNASDMTRQPYNPSPSSGKRKSSDVDEFGRQVRYDSSPPSKKNKLDCDSTKGLSKKEKRTQRKLEAQRMTYGGDDRFMGDAEKRRARFGNVTSPTRSPVSDDLPIDNNVPFVGTCQKIEKSYFRLTSAAKREDVRPLPVLKEALDMVIAHWKSKENYNYAREQLKSIRQDMTVQRIKNEFTVRVYECHARIALQEKDMGEYNQCQTQLVELHRQKLGGHPGEFLAYRILYILYTCNKTDMSDLLADLTPKDKEDESVKFALEVRKALASGNYHKLFRLYHADTKDMSQYLLNMFVDRERTKALAYITKAYKAGVSVDFIVKELGFVDDENRKPGERLAQEQCTKLIKDSGAEHMLVAKLNGMTLNGNGIDQAFKRAHEVAVNRDAGPGARPAG